MFDVNVHVIVPMILKKFSRMPPILEGTTRCNLGGPKWLELSDKQSVHACIEACLSVPF